MASALHLPGRWAVLAAVFALLVSARPARAQDLGSDSLSALDLLARGPELGASDVPGESRARKAAADITSRTLADPPVKPPERVSSDSSLPEPMAEVAVPPSRWSPAERPAFKPLPAVAAVVPGLVLHGLGPWLAGDAKTGRQLFALEGAGLGLIAVGGVPIVLTGASRRTIGPLYAVTLAGAGLFSISALSNLYAVMAPVVEPGVVPASLPPLELEMGYQYVHDPAFQYDHFVALGAVARVSAFRLEAAARMAPGEGNTRVRAGGAYRLMGAPEQTLGQGDGTSLDAELFALYHRFPTEGFTVGGGEAGLRGRYAMARLSPRLEGAFAEASLGMSFQGYSYPGPPSDDNLHEQLLFTFGYGVWLGRGGPLRGEAMIFYDHRKDDLAGGMRTLGGGVVGSVGLRGRVLLSNSWGIAAEAQAGGALVGRLSLLYALGGET
ncbi:hypothetical protein DRW03_20080 [Corallococcus sp. H22C18031201]|nr:hypothetical protein DRW03_20080 [Corallococcus sp. H22C18031201]